MCIRDYISLAVLLLAGISAPASEMAILRNGFSIRHDARAVVGDMTRLYTSVDKSSYVDIPTAQIDHFEADLVPPPKPAIAFPVTKNLNVKKDPDLKEVIQGASDKHFLDADLINSVIRAESGFKVRAVSPKGARGLMQLMPGTASTLGVSDVFDPQANVEGGTQYLRWLLDRYHYDLAKALAAYNAGPHRVEQYRGVPPYAETQAYVARIIRDFNRQKLAERKAAAASLKPGAVKAGAKKSEPRHAYAKTTAAAGAAN
jgi:soluble lytic murein transglycosylase-like protein